MDFNSQTPVDRGDPDSTMPPTQLDFEDEDAHLTQEDRDETEHGNTENTQQQDCLESAIDSLDSDFYSSLNSDGNTNESIVLGYTNTDSPFVDGYNLQRIYSAGMSDHYERNSLDSCNELIRNFEENKYFTKNHELNSFTKICDRRHSTESEILRELTNHTNREDKMHFSNSKNKKLKLENTNFAISQSLPREDKPRASPRGLQRMKSLSIQSSSNLCKLPSLPTILPQSSPIHHITPSTVVSLLKGIQYPTLVDFVLIDCRFNYEIKGGSILNSNYCRTRKNIQKLFNKLKLLDGNMAVIFYCEFSRNRSPVIASYFRQLDRLNSTYPNLSFPDTYILEGGYKGFWEHVNKPMCLRNERKIECFNVNGNNVKEKVVNSNAIVERGDEEKRKLFSRYGYVSMWDNKFKRKCNKKNRNMKREWSKSVVNGLI
eukprot:GAHX01001289.1.p1 GENE.GAHX01001289.1~~GAHX01001289.1.p1  ORF type:complete len:431 (+),score=63.14 GAHX01001289.1:36-1328(+)